MKTNVPRLCPRLARRFFKKKKQKKEVPMCILIALGWGGGARERRNVCGRRVVTTQLLSSERHTKTHNAKGSSMDTCSLDAHTELHSSISLAGQDDDTVSHTESVKTKRLTPREPQLRAPIASVTN